jgi:hypothetical protein
VRKLWLLALLTSVLAITSSAAATTSDTEIFRGPTTDTAYNPCVDELVTTTGTFVAVDHQTTTENGETHAVLFRYEGMTATGLVSGVRYIESRVEEESSYMSSPAPPMEFTHTSTLVLNRLSPTGAMTDDDYLLHTEAHGTVSASGVVTLESLDFKPECR